MASVLSAVESLTASGVLLTPMLRSEHAVTLMLSYPAPLWQMNLRLEGKEETSSLSKGPVTLVESFER